MAKEPPLAGKNAMNVVFVGAECAPWSKTGERLDTPPPPPAGSAPGPLPRSPPIKSGTAEALSLRPAPSSPPPRPPPGRPRDHPQSKMGQKKLCRCSSEPASRKQAMAGSRVSQAGAAAR